MVLHLLRADSSLRNRIAVVDESGEWLTGWQGQFARLGISVLRSPGVHHPGPDVHALSDFVADRRMLRSGLPYDLPRAEAFEGFCRHLIEDADLAAPIACRAIDSERVGRSILLRTTGPDILATRVVVASNPHKRVIPDWVWGVLGQGCTGIAHADDVDLRQLSDLRGESITVVGGGLSAGHLACGAAQRGAHVRLVSRRPLQVRPFDTDPGWLGPKNLADYSATDDPLLRLRQARAARGGGTMPQWMHDRIQDAVAAGVISLHESDVTSATPHDGRCRLALANDTTMETDRLWLATGTCPDLSAIRFLDPLLPDVVEVDGYPLTDANLRVGAHPIHVMGRLATLTLGPAAGNLWGARHAARRITQAITGVDLDALTIRAGKTRNKST